VLCPGNVRANGMVNLDYESFCFENDFAALKQEEIAFEEKTK
jgi:UDPglucose--hexose-1-phosphate uridylyltransferase